VLSTTVDSENSLPTPPKTLTAVCALLQALAEGAERKEIEKSIEKIIK
jgi:hypothetical protein